MQLEGNRVINAPRADVWRALNDPEVLKNAIPGCTEMTGSAEDGFEAKVTQKVGPVKANFAGAVRLENIVEGESYTIEGEGKGGPAGFAKGAADVKLVSIDENTTDLIYVVDAKVGGKIAQLGGRIIDGFAKKMADEFFKRFAEEVEGPSGEAEVDVAEAVEENGDEPVKKKGFFGKLKSAIS